MATSKSQLRVPCCYQGGKQRVAQQIVNELLCNRYNVNADTEFYDICCGSGAITIELLNRGVNPQNITMLDKSSWGVFWRTIGSGEYDLGKLRDYIDAIPSDKRLIKQHMQELSRGFIGDDEPYIYPVLQSCSFGGKQISRIDNMWENAFFRSYWEPKPTSIRRSPANPMQPSPSTLYKRIERITAHAIGLKCLVSDVSSLLNMNFNPNSVLYIDPPYMNTTGYAFGFDIMNLVNSLRQVTNSPIVVSEGRPLADDSMRLSFGGAKGGISGNKRFKHEEWLSFF